jgi:hypothetical protein
MGVANGERQIKIAGRGAGIIEEARADQASYSSAYFAGTSIGKGPTRPAFRPRSSATIEDHWGKVRFTLLGRTCAE